MTERMETRETDRRQIKRSGRALGWLFLGVFLVFGELLGAFLQEVFNIIGQELVLPRLEDASLFLGSNVTQLVKLAILGIFYLFTKGKMRRVPMVKQDLEPGLLPKAIIWMFGVNMVLSVVQKLLTYFSDISLGLPVDFTLIGGPLAMFLMIALFPAIVEEIMFRFIFYRFLRRHGIVFAAVASSVLFGLTHMNILQAVFAAMMGLILCYVYEKTGKLRYPILLHLLNNSFSVLMMNLSVSETVATIINILTIVIILGGTIYLGIRDRAENKQLLAKIRGAARPLKYFFTSIPMLLYTIIAIGFSIWLVFFIMNNRYK